MKLKLFRWNKGICLVITVLTCLNSYSQHNLFVDFEDLRNLNTKDEYLNIDSLFVKGEELKTAIKLDSLAREFYKKENYPEYLFCKNQEARLYKKLQHFKQATDTLITSRKKFSCKYDTLHIEYIISYYINVFIPPRYYSKYYPRHEIIDRGLEICRLMHYDDLETTDNPFVKLLQFGVKEAFYRRDFEKSRFNNAELRKILKQKRSYYELADMDRIFFSKIATDERDLQQTIPLAYSTYIDLIKNDWDKYEGYHDLAAETILRLSKTPTSLYIQQGDYQKAVDIFEKVPLELVPKNSIFLADAHTCMACCYLKVNDTINGNKYLEKALKDVYSKKFFVDNRSLLLSNFALQLFPIKPELASQLIDSAIHITTNKHRIDYAGFTKLTSLKKVKRYAEAIEWSKAMFDTDTTGGNQKVIFNFEKIIHRFLCSMDLTICAYNEFINTGSQELKNLYENQAIETHKIYVELWNQNLSSHELNSIQNDYNVYFEEIILQPFQNGFNFDIIDDHFISELILASKSQATLNSINRIAKENTTDKSDTLFQAYSKNLNAIQDYKNKVAKFTQENMVDSICLAFFDLIYQNYWLRHDITKLTANSNEVHDTINTIEQLQAKLKPNQAIIEYYVTDSSLYSILIKHNYYNVYFNANKNIIKLANQAWRQIKTNASNYSKVEGLSSGLFAESWESYLDNVDELIIIPHGILNKIPFEVLPSKYNPNQKLIDKYVITYNYSSQIWLKQSGKKRNNQLSLIVTAPFAKKRFSNDSVLIDDKYRGEIRLASLPYSGQEANEVYKLFKQNNLKSVALIGKDAVEASYRKQGNNFTITHLATHGYVNKKNYEESGVYFYKTQDMKTIPNNDNYLSLGEVYALDSRPNLVVLSGCKTGTGAIVEGEGVMALPRGFIYAGVPNVIASLWKVHDEKTKDLMVAFYKHLLENQLSYAEALRLAKLDCIEKGFLPLDWAGFLLIGN